MPEPLEHGSARIGVYWGMRRPQRKSDLVRSLLTAGYVTSRSSQYAAFLLLALPLLHCPVYLSFVMMKREDESDKE